MQDKRTESAYQECLQQARIHYENFPTASRIIQKKHRNATAAIYSFARRADDIADEGNKPDTWRHNNLEQFSNNLDKIFNHKPVNDATFIALADTVERYQLPKAPLEKLLIAFTMDIDKKRHANLDELLYYCQHSANPVGELVLRLHGFWNETTQELSDHICTSLQLINFIQDIRSDLLLRNRIYIPQDEMKLFEVNEQQLKSGQDSAQLSKLIGQQLERASNMLLSGVPLTRYLTGRLKWVIRLTITSGLLICQKLSCRTSVFARPVLTRSDWLKIAYQSLYFRPDRTHAKIIANIRKSTSNG